MATQTISFKKFSSSGTIPSKGLSKGKMYFVPKTGLIHVATSATAYETYGPEISIKETNGTELATIKMGSTTYSLKYVNSWRPITDSVNTTDSNTSASATAVKTAYDLAASKTANTGTVTKVSTGAGLTGGDVTTTGTIKANLKSETKSSLEAADMGSTADRQYAVGLDSKGYLSVNVPWINTKNTAGSTNSTSKLFLVGAASQGTNPQTYSNSGCYTSGGHLYSNSKMVITDAAAAAGSNINSVGIPSVTTSTDTTGKTTFTFNYLKGAKGDPGTNATTTNVVSTSANGLAPKVTNTSGFLRGDGVWATPTFTESYTGTVTSITPGTGLTNGTTENAITSSGTLNLKTASSTEIGGIKTGYSESGKNYAVKLDSNNKAYVNVPWVDSAASTSANGLMTTTMVSKLNGIASGATNVTESTVSGWGFTKNAGTILKVKINGEEKTPNVNGVVELGEFSTTDEKVTQTVSTSNYNYPILTKSTNSTSTTTAATSFSAYVTLNPSTRLLQVGSSSSSSYYGKVQAGGGFFQTSDERLKNFGEDVKINFEVLKSIPKKYFTWKDDENNKLNIGTSAQEIQKIYPELVSETDGVLTVDYNKLSIVALKAVDELYDKNKELEARIEKLEKLLIKE